MGDDAVRRPMGAYFRVNHTDLVAMHSAIAEVGVLYATSSVHAGWDHVGARRADRRRSQSITGGHAFAIVAYDEHGFWIQNSWGNVLGLPRLRPHRATTTGSPTLPIPGSPGSAPRSCSLDAAYDVAARGSWNRQGSQSYVFRDLRPHIISLGNDGQPRTDGTLRHQRGRTSRRFFETDFPDDHRRMAEKIRQTAPRCSTRMAGSSARTRRSRWWPTTVKPCLPPASIPVSFHLEDGLPRHLKDILEDALRRRRPEGALDATQGLHARSGSTMRSSRSRAWRADCWSGRR